MIYDTFARRGVGVGANSGGVTITDQVESFTTLTPGSTPATGSACTTLFTNQFDINSKIAIYPNPNTGLFTIKVSQFEDIAGIEILDMNGRIVCNQKRVDFSIEKSINLSYVQAGVYIVKVKGENSSLVKKLIIE